VRKQFVRSHVHKLLLYDNAQMDVWTSRKQNAFGR